MQPQTLPASATEYDAAQRAELAAAVAAVGRQWRRVGGDFDSGWARVAPTVEKIVITAQQRNAARAAAFIPVVLEDTGQSQAITPVARTNVAAVLGITGAGVTILDSLNAAPIRAKQAVSEGLSQFLALQHAGDWLSRSVGTIVSDTSRTVESLGTYTRPIGGYVRMLTPPSCGRCVIMAGRWYPKSTGFRRHPDCDCRMIPASEAISGDMTVDPQAYFDSLNAAAQAKLMGSAANAKAVRDGADMGQIINAYRKTAGMQVAQVAPIQSLQVGHRTAKFTLEGTTRRGSAYKAMRAHGAVIAAEDARAKGERYFRAKPVRVMPETIYSAARDRADALRLLRLYGWIS